MSYDIYTVSLRQVYEHARALAPLMLALIRVRAKSGKYLGLERRERMRAHTQIAELPKIKRRLILNNTRFGHPRFHATNNFKGLRYLLYRDRYN